MANNSQAQDLPAPLAAMFGEHHDAARDAHIQAVLETYCRKISCGDLEGVISLFAPNAYVEDPIGSPRRPAREFFSGVFEHMGGFVDLRLEGAVRVSGDYAAAALNSIVTIDGEHVAIDTLDIMHFDKDGLIASMQAYWGPLNVRISDKPPVRTTNA